MIELYCKGSGVDISIQYKTGEEETLILEPIKEEFLSGNSISSVLKEEQEKKLTILVK